MVPKHVGAKNLIPFVIEELKSNLWLKQDVLIAVNNQVSGLIELLVFQMMKNVGATT